VLTLSKEMSYMPFDEEVLKKSQEENKKLDNFKPNQKFVNEDVSEQKLIYSNLDESTKQIILAQNRTTHAIRAVVRFLFIQLTAITLAFVIGGLGSAFGNAFVIFIAVVIYIIGIVWSSNAGWSELEKSNIPK
jgi:ABC-type multidrug transport system fused ATPase/permease subunit